MSQETRRHGTIPCPTAGRTAARVWRGEHVTSLQRVRLRAVGLAIAVVAALVASAPIAASAQTPFVPYFGKNQVRYDHFRWQIYTTEHFEIYYYPEIEQHLERIASYAESAYQHISSELKYDLAFKVPLIIFKTSSEFQEQNIVPEQRRKVWAPLPNPSASASCSRSTIRRTFCTGSSSTS